MALREGYTTGTCAAAAAKAAAIFLAEKICVNQVKVTGPTGREFLIDVFKIAENKFGAVKDSGDDVDITNGMTVCAELEILDNLDNKNKILFEAGDGVGVITLPGMKLPVGEAAINPGPRTMIANALREVLGEDICVKVIISIPGGLEKAQHTFNPRLGVKGGLSVLGTTGVVKPMDEAALIASLDLELSVIYSLGVKDLI
ncbi:MAG: cobalt-precorrin-5B (C(1))-methyltransferase, partial [Synergistaceae bacterium]|nr:cobalt-precorrin-5B (C(1))-methyltransferase [Synergistaceae bacterium]